MGTPSIVRLLAASLLLPWPAAAQAPAPPVAVTKEAKEAPSPEALSRDPRVVQALTLL